MLGRFREKYENAMVPLGLALGNAGINPNALSVVAALLAVPTALLYARGLPLVGASVVLCSAFVDMLDGAVARATGRVSRFGAVLDHVLDRYVEYALVIGVVAGGFAGWFWGVFALIGMILASYSRAAAESVGGLEECTVGIAERQEKLLVILAGSFLVVLWSSALEYAMILIGALSHVTVIQRLLYAKKKAGGS